MSEKANLSFIFILPILLILTALLTTPLDAIFSGLYKIILSKSILFTDYIEIGGFGAALFNAGLCGLIACILIVILKIYVSGPFIAAVFTIIGFAFFGKNIFNIWPIFIGGFIFAKIQKAPLKQYFLISLFGTTLAPLISFLAFGAGFSKLYGILIGWIIGIIVGFILPPLAAHMLKFHSDYNLYNTGFTGGIIGSFVTAVLRAFDIVIENEKILNETYDVFFKIYFLCFFIFLLLLSFLFSIFDLKKLKISLKKILESPGRLISDFILIGGLRVTIFNMGVMGCISLIFLTLIGGKINGPIIGAILTVVGFSAFGKHPKNTVQILIGVYLASTIKIYGSNIFIIALCGLFSTTLAPIAGKYGFFAGIIAGFFHLSVVMNVGILHGGVNLYNNGFAGGFVAACLIPVIYALSKEKED